MAIRLLKLCAIASLIALAVGCTTPTRSLDYSAFKASQPRSIVALPPLNESPDADATYGMLSQVTVPLAEAGYYVLPVALVDETFRQNGVTVAGDIHGVSVDKLRQIFGADAALYITVSHYGAKYRVLDSAAVVEASAKLVDLKTGQTLWAGQASASSNERNDIRGGGLVDMLVTAAVKQIINSATDRSHDVAGITATRLLSAGQPDGLLYGPRSPRYGMD